MDKGVICCRIMYCLLVLPNQVDCEFKDGLLSRGGGGGTDPWLGIGEPLRVSNPDPV